MAAFIADQANAGFRAFTLGRRVVAIAYAHGFVGLESLTNSKTVRVVLGGVRRKIGTRPAQKAPAAAERIAVMLADLPDTLTSKRNRALIALGFAGAFHRSELVALEIADLAFEPEGMRVHIRQSKTDQEGCGQEIAIPRGIKLRPVKAVQDWMRAAKIKEGLLFRSIDRHGTVGTALSGKSVALIIKQHADAAGLDPREFAGHSVRAGFVTSAAEAGADVLQMMEVSRHKRVETVQGYVQRANSFKDMPESGFYNPLGGLGRGEWTIQTLHQATLLHRLDAGRWPLEDSALHRSTSATPPHPRRKLQRLQCRQSMRQISCVHPWR